jgi:cyanobactin maturation PatA/PatG family protease
VPDNAIAAELSCRLPGLSRLWALTRGRPDIVVAVLDGPVEATAVAQGMSQSGVVEHGTHVYSIIAGSSDAIIPGVAPGCTIISIPIFAAGPRGTPQTCTQQELAAAIHRALERRANVINISAAQQADPLLLSAELSQALQEASARDVLVVAAAGNQGCACDTIPASVPGVLAVGAHAEDGSPLVSSNWGPGQRAQGVLAPGAGIPGACVGGGLCRASGTSFAAATVSGIAGLLMSVEAERGAKPSGSRIRHVLLNSSVRPTQPDVQMAASFLAGRLDVSRALYLVIGPSANASTREETLSTSSLPTNSDGRTAEPGPAQSPAQGAAAGHVAAAHAGTMPAPETARPSGRGLVPADCGCGSTGGECSCGGAAKKPQLVYAIGRLGVSYVSQTRRVSIWRAMNEDRNPPVDLTDANLQVLFTEKPHFAQSVVWTVTRTEVPMYAVIPMGAYAAETYKWLAKEWADKDVEFISLPGFLAGQVTLYDGQIVDAVVPDLRGMVSWDTDVYVTALKDSLKSANPNLADEVVTREMKRFFGKIYYSIRNRGLLPEERAINAAATNAFNVGDTIVEAGQEGLTLRDVGVERSPLNRPGSEYFDVLFTFFDPAHRTERAPLRARFTIDVSDTVPVPIGSPVTWHEY